MTMEAFGLNEALRDKAKGNGWHYLFGDELSKNIDATSEDYNRENWNDYLDGEYILSWHFPTISPEFHHSLTTKVTYTGAIGLGLKADAVGTESNLDEVFEVKYNNRLRILSEMLANFIASFGCENELVMSNVRLIYKVNQYDECVDFVEAEVTVAWEA